MSGEVREPRTASASEETRIPEGATPTRVRAVMARRGLMLNQLLSYHDPERGYVNPLDEHETQASVRVFVSDLDKWLSAADAAGLEGDSDPRPRKHTKACEDHAATRFDADCICPREGVSDAPLADALREVLDDDEADLSDCPYLARWESAEGHDPEATCAYGCTDEPQCVTCVPEGGWPRVRARAALAEYDAARPALDPEESR